MAYVPTSWVPGVFGTELTSARLNNIETGIVGSVAKGTLRINVADYASLTAAFAAAPAGSYIYVPSGTYVNPTGLGNGATLLADNITVEFAPGAEIQVNTWGQAGIDCFNRSGINILGAGIVRFTGTRINAGTGSYRGSNETSGTAGVYINRDRCTVDGLRTINMPVCVYLSSYDGSTSQDRQGVGNTVRNVECEGMDFGVLFTRQKGLRISNVYGHDDIDDSGGLNPTHVIYAASSDASVPAQDIVISNCVAQNIDTGHAYQLKWCSNVQANNLVARNALALTNMVGCTDVTFTGSLVDAKETTISPSGWITVQDFASARIKLRASIIADATGADHRAVHIAANDSVFELDLTTRRKSAAAASTAEVRVLGKNNKVMLNNLTNVSAYPAPAVQVGDATNDSSGNRIIVGSVAGCSRLVDMWDTAGGSTVQYAADHVALTTGTTVSVISGTPSYRVFETVPAVIPPLWVPSDNGYLGSTCDPQFASIGQGAMTAGVLYLARIKVPVAGTIATVRFGVTTAGSGLTSGQCLVGVYNSAGTLIGTSADLSTDLASTGTKAPAITVVGGQSLAIAAGGAVFIGLLQNGTTPAQVRGTPSAGGFANDQVTGLVRRYGTYGTSQTALPSTVTALTANTAQWWFAVA